MPVGVRAHAAVPERCHFLLRPDVSGWDSADSLAVGRPLPRIADQGEGLRGEADLDPLAPRQPEAVALHPVAECDEPVAEDLETEGPRRQQPLGQSGFLEATGSTTNVDGGRPAALFRRGPATLLHPALLRVDA